ncbi:DUF4157 domain-containing protein [Streptomyces sp. NPDC001941]|uniref:eCIS core domain-containing protein n=1 Tax=Streptomyces sp. NPDC001941 TaxID=3154659 RepID=UPI00332B9A34
MRRAARDQAAEAQARDAAARPSGAPSAEGLLALQRSAGNAAVTRMLAARQAAGDGVDGAPDQDGATAHQVLRSPGKALDGAVRAEMEGRLGADFSDVRVHSDAVAQRSATEIGARAYTSGSHVVVTDAGRDKHTLAHELTHVIQQRQGPVSGTDTGDGLSVSDPGDRFEREAEANARRVMAGPAPVGCAAGEEAGASGHDHGSGVVQRKGFDEIGPQLPPSPPPAGGLLGQLIARTRNQPSPQSAQVARVRQAFSAYDDDTNRDPMHCMMALSDIQMDIAPAQDGAEGGLRGFLGAALQVINGELDLVTNQLARDNAFPDEARPPFDAMTDTGMLWKRGEWADSAAAFQMEGAKYFRELSEMNRAGMAKEIAGGGQQRDWVGDVRNKLTSALQQSVLCHYTQADRAAQMLGGGQVLSKTELLKRDPDAENTSEGYDKHVLGNEGFVFFFLEAPDSPFRGSRFGGDDPVRIEIPLASSPLMREGWLMLSDFAQREYPTLRSDPADPARTQSKLPTREEGFGPEFTDQVRKFDLGAGQGADHLDMMQLIEERRAEPDPERGAQIMYALSQALADQYSTMTYGSGEDAVVKPEPLRSNTLMGRDIVPGLADKAIVEIQRIEQVNPQLAERLKGMGGTELMTFLLKDLLRPQAMLPNTVSLAGARVVRENGQQLAAPATTH